MSDLLARLRRSVRLLETPMYDLAGGQTADEPTFGYHIAVSRRIDAPPTRVWVLLTDTRWWPQWGPSITAIEPSAGRIDAGTSGRIRVVGGLWLPFVVESYVAEPAGRRWTWRIGPVRATGHRVEPLPSDSEGCRVVFEVPVSGGPYALVCAIALERIARLAARVETDS